MEPSTTKEEKPSTKGRKKTDNKEEKPSTKGRKKTDNKEEKPPPSLLKDSEEPVYRTRKFLQKKLVRPNDSVKIEEAVIVCHKTATLGLDFTKLYTLHLHHQGEPLPVLDTDFYSTVLRVVSKRKSGGGRPFSINIQLYNKLLDFHTTHFLPLSPVAHARIAVENVSHIFYYIADTFAVTQKVNITKNFPTYIKRFVNKYFLKQLYELNHWSSERKMTKQEKATFYREVKHVKEDLLWCRKWTTDGYKSDPKYHEMLDASVGTLFPEPVDRMNEWGLYRDVRVQPNNYLQYMIDINIELESWGCKLFSPICIRSSLSQRYIKIDTAALVDLLITEDDIKSLSLILDLPNLTTKNDLTGSLSTLYGRKTSKQEAFYFKTKVWEHCLKFNTNKYTRGLLKSHNYVFDNSILTDGVGVSVLQVRTDRVGFGCKANNNHEFRLDDPDVPYLNELSQSEREHILAHDVIIGGDPGKNDIIYMIDDQGNTLRYTAQQRAVECHYKKNKKAIVSMKKTTVCSNGLTVEQIEKNITYNSRSCLSTKTRHYITERRKLESLVFPTMYSRDTIRKLRFSAYSHKNESEDKLLKTIVSTFRRSDKDGITIAWGNWSQPQQMKNCVSTPNIGLRRRLSRKGKELGLKIGREYEAFSSCTCHDCHGKTGYCKKRRYIGKDGIRQTRFIHGLLRCQNEACSRRWNRNVLGSLNILEIAMATLQGHERPSHFTLGHALEGGVGGEPPENDGLIMNFTG